LQRRPATLQAGVVKTIAAQPVSFGFNGATGDAEVLISHQVPLPRQGMRWKAAPARLLREITVTEETSTTFPVTSVRSKDIPVVVGTEVPLAPSKAKEKAVGSLLQSTEVVFPVTVVKTYTVGLTQEADSTAALSSTKSKGIGIAAESSFELPIEIPDITVIEVGITAESSQALSLQQSIKTKAVALATETDASLTPTPTKTSVIGLATEIQTPIALGITQKLFPPLGILSESDQALQSIVAKLTQVGIAQHGSEALPLDFGFKEKFVGLITEVDEALGFDPALPASGRRARILNVPAKAGRVIDA
jgi:hypothetical protein